MCIGEKCIHYEITCKGKARFAKLMPDNCEFFFCTIIIINPQLYLRDQEINDCNSINI